MPSGRTAYEKGSAPRGRSRLWIALVAIIAAALVAGVVVLGLVDVAPAPHSVEKVISSDRLSR